MAQRNDLDYSYTINGSKAPYTDYLKKKYYIQFENARLSLKDQEPIRFKAFITAFKDLFKPEWNEETVFGRTEPIGIYKGISRRLAFGFDAPADSVAEGKRNLKKVEELIMMLYPTYHTPNEKDENYRVLSQAPLIRLSFVNIVNNKIAEPERGLLGYITSLDYDLNFGKDVGVFDGEVGVLAPRVISFNIDFTVLHEIPLGFDEEGKFASKEGWLYNIDAQSVQEQQNEDQKQLGLQEQRRQQIKEKRSAEKAEPALVNQIGDAKAVLQGIEQDAAALGAASPIASLADDFMEDQTGMSAAERDERAASLTEAFNTAMEPENLAIAARAREIANEPVDFYTDPVGATSTSTERYNAAVDQARTERSGIGAPRRPPAFIGDLTGRQD